ncbi:hypothetical protein [Streptomyces lavendulae]|uniref:hypothetical protein n=1 Tax=Streptomyces lavendulae TaxID=1914 RepID=UPI0031EE235E
MNRDRLAAALAPLTAGIHPNLWRTPSRRARADRALFRLAHAKPPAPPSTDRTEGTAP